VAALKSNILSHRSVDGLRKLHLYWKKINKTTLISLRDFHPQLVKTSRTQSRVGRLERLSGRPVRKGNLRLEKRPKRGPTGRGKS
jgi:hypothetical protein